MGKNQSSEDYLECTLTRFLQRLGVNPIDAESDACKMEHIISDASFDAIKKFLDK